MNHLTKLLTSCYNATNDSSKTKRYIWNVPRRLWVLWEGVRWEASFLLVLRCLDVANLVHRQTCRVQRNRRRLVQWSAHVWLTGRQLIVRANICAKLKSTKSVLFLVSAISSGLGNCGEATPIAEAMSECSTATCVVTHYRHGMWANHRFDRLWNGEIFARKTKTKASFIDLKFFRKTVD